ncbi:MAG: hypothetical protein D6723_15080 [Acidobacteria bacterium]|nr:MAG: hypothetical protein D6723_15080 [Acidobacteriota bacterium]
MEDLCVLCASAVIVRVRDEDVAIAVIDLQLTERRKFDTPSDGWLMNACSHKAGRVVDHDWRCMLCD